MRWFKALLFFILAIVCYAIGNIAGLILVIALGLICEGLMWFTIFRKSKKGKP